MVLLDLAVIFRNDFRRTGSRIQPTVSGFIGPRVAINQHRESGRREKKKGDRIR